ncbi:MAG: hypothetical protein G01um101466_2 [Parcubacteria group bacterium Gr01-1014_66]|nr:MAG: hypothetical protein G01um101466_2 [Parcubacteria group bacterium Gr01-1014_66]
MDRVLSSNSADIPLLCILDWDGVLFDDAQFKRAYQDIFEKIGIMQDEYEKTYDAAKEKVGGWYAPDAHLKVMRHIDQRVPVREIKRDIKNLLEQSASYLYPDSIPFLRLCRTQKIGLALASTGPAFQKKKIASSGITSFFDATRVIRNTEKIKALRGIMRKISARKVLFVDDKSEVVDSIEAALPQVMVVQMMRQDWTGKSDKADAWVQNFTGVKKIIESLC